MKHNRIYLLTFYLLLILFSMPQAKQNKAYKLTNSKKINQLDKFSSTYDNEKKKYNDLNIEAESNEEKLAKRFYMNLKRTSDLDIFDSVIVIKESGVKIKYTFKLDENKKWVNQLLEVKDSDSTEWQDSSRTVYQYNNSGLLTFLKTEKWDSTKWLITVRQTATYDLDSNVTLRLTEYFVGGLLAGSSRHSYKYDISGNNLEHSYENWQGNILVNRYRYTRVYDGNGDKIEEKQERLSNNEFSNLSLWKYNYDSNRNLIKSQRNNWKNNDWENDALRTYEHDSNNNIISELNESWDKNIEVWKFNQRYSNSYDINKNLTHQLREKWNSSDSNWYNYTKYYAEFDSFSNQTFFLNELFNLTDSTWEYYERRTTTFNESGDRLIDIIEEFDDGELEQKIRRECSYDERGNLIAKLNEVIKDGQVQNVSSYVTLSYDNNNNQIYFLSAVWDGLKFQNSYKLINEYSLNGNLLVAQHEKWENEKWESYDRPIYYTDVFDNEYYFHWGAELQVYYVESLTDVTDQHKSPSKYSLSQNYPNPFNPSTTIKYHIPQVQTTNGKINNVTLKVYDVLGREVKTLVNQKQNPGSYEVNFNASELSSGIYFYRLQAGDPSSSSGHSFIETKKLTLLK